LLASATAATPEKMIKTDRVAPTLLVSFYTGLVSAETYEVAMRSYDISKVYATERDLLRQQ